MRRTMTQLMLLWSDAKLTCGEIANNDFQVTQQADLSGRTGTLVYMAPEVYLKQPYSTSADVYSFAIVAYQVLHRYLSIMATGSTHEACMVISVTRCHTCCIIGHTSWCCLSIITDLLHSSITHPSLIHHSGVCQKCRNVRFPASPRGRHPSPISPHH